MSAAGRDLVRAGARRVALLATGIVAGVYLLIAIAVVLIVTHNLTASIDDVLSQALATYSLQRSGPRGPLGPPRGGPQFGAPVLYWVWHPDGGYVERSSQVSQNLPVPITSIRSPRTLTVAGTDLRVMGAEVGDDWAVVAQSMDPVYQARANMIFAEVVIGPVLLGIVFLGALTIGSRVAAPIERARRRQMDFTANASHELRTPLSVIEAQTSLALDRERDGAWYRQAFLRVDQESKRMRRLVEDLLWLARMDATADSAQAEPVDVGVVAQQGVDRFAGVAEARLQRLSLQVSGDSHVISATAEWLEHLVGVLLDNACKYAPEGGHVDVHVTADGDRVRLAVDDSGPGIPEQQRSRIFDRFQRANEHAAGAGLGLAIADAVVRATNGRWEVGTSSAGGASMAISWPRILSGSRTAGVPLVSQQPQLDT